MLVEKLMDKTLDALNSSFLVDAINAFCGEDLWVGVLSYSGIGFLGPKNLQKRVDPIIFTMLSAYDPHLGPMPVYIPNVSGVDLPNRHGKDYASTVDSTFIG